MNHVTNGYHAFYGTLRKGQYNYDRFKLDKTSSHLGTHVVPGFKLIDCHGMYPKAIPGEQTDTITVEIMKIKDQDVADYIHMMERGAGYKQIVINVNNFDCVMYIDAQTSKKVQEAIPGGDWVKYNTEKQHGRRSSKV